MELVCQFSQKTRRVPILISRMVLERDTGGPLHCYAVIGGGCVARDLDMAIAVGAAIADLPREVEVAA
jgi:hypothetical protein